MKNKLYKSRKKEIEKSFDKIGKSTEHRGPIADYACYADRLLETELSELSDYFDKAIKGYQKSEVEKNLELASLKTILVIADLIIKKKHKEEDMLLYLKLKSKGVAQF